MINFKHCNMRRHICRATLLAAIASVAACGGGNDGTSTTHQAEHNTNTQADVQSASAPPSSTRHVEKGRLQLWNSNIQETYQSLLDSGQKTIAIPIPNKAECQNDDRQPPHTGASNEWPSLFVAWTAGTPVDRDANDYPRQQGPRAGPVRQRENHLSEPRNRRPYSV